MDRCGKCGAKLRGRKFSSPLGDEICARCHDKIVGGVAAMQTGDVGLGAVLAGKDERRSNGALAWIRRALGRDRS